MTTTASPQQCSDAARSDAGAINADILLACLSALEKHYEDALDEIKQLAASATEVDSEIRAVTPLLQNWSERVACWISPEDLAPEAPLALQRLAAMHNALYVAATTCGPIGNR